MYKQFLMVALATSSLFAQQPISNSHTEVASNAMVAPSDTASTRNEAGAAVAIALPVRPKATSARCASGDATKQECKEHWAPMLRQSLEWVLMQNSMNLALGPDFRSAISHGNFFSNYVDAATTPHRFTHWDDGDEFLVNFIGHPMMGSVVDNIYIQNDPKAAGLTVGKNKAYWTAHGRALLFTAAYTFQWKIGPLGEASIGNVGKQTYASPRTGKLTNGAGLVDFVVTPVVGTAWNIGEDTLDRFVVSKWRSKTKNPLLLTSLSFLTPTRSMANVVRFKSPWYRDNQ